MTVNQMLISLYAGNYDKDKKVFGSNIGGWETSEYPVYRVSKEKIRKCQLTPEFHTDNSLVDVVVLFELYSSKYDSEKYITAGELVEYLESVKGELPVGVMTDLGFQGNGYFCEVLHIGNANDIEVVKNVAARKCYGENIFRIYY